MLQARPSCPACAKEMQVSAEKPSLSSTLPCSKTLQQCFSAELDVFTWIELQPLALQVEQRRADGGAGVWIEHAGLQAVVRHILESAAAQLGGK